jgi:hypothetical protein
MEKMLEELLSIQGAQFILTRERDTLEIRSWKTER